MKAALSRKPASTLLLIGLAGTATANLMADIPSHPADENLSAHVHYADLDLTTQAGADTLYSRLANAAGRVCDRFDRQYLEDLALWNACFQKALADAVAQVNAPRVTAIYRRRQRESRPLIR